MLVEVGGLLEGMLKEGGSIGRGEGRGREGGGRKGVSPAVDRRLATHKPACAAPSRSESNISGTSEIIVQFFNTSKIFAFWFLIACPHIRGFTIL